MSVKEVTTSSSMGKIAEIIETDGRFTFEHIGDYDYISNGYCDMYMGNGTYPTLVVNNATVGDVCDVIYMLNLKPYTYHVCINGQMSMFPHDIIKPYSIGYYAKWDGKTEVYTGSPIYVIDSHRAKNAITYKEVTGDDVCDVTITYPSGVFNYITGEDTGTGFAEYYCGLAMTVLPVNRATS